MICVYSKTNTDYTKNGDAVLIPTSAYLSMTINGAWQLTLEHPYDEEERYKLLVEGNIIRADIGCIRELGTVQQRFRIYNYQKNMNSITVIAFPIAMESNFDAPIDNIVINDKTGIQAMALLQEKIGSNKYILSTDISTSGSTSLANTNINQAIASGDAKCFIKVWGGEVLYDNLNFKVKARLGDNTASDHKIAYGDNLTGINYEKDDSGVTTRIYPISQDGIRLNGNGYVQSPDHYSDYPIPHCRYMTAPYTLVNLDASSNTNTADMTRQAISDVTTQATTDSHTGCTNALNGGVQPEYIKSIRSEINKAIKTTALAGVSSSSLYSALGAAIDNATAWLGELEQPEWGWMGDAETGWKYGNESSYAKNEYVRIGKKWSYFGNDGVWQEPRDDSAEWDWYQSSGVGKKYGNFKKYFAHNEYVYITESGTLTCYWFNEQGWYESEYTEASSWTWHGSGTAEDPYWFGEEDAGDNSKKYAHDCWIFIDGVYYFFDSEGYYDGSTKFDNYQWDWVEDDERFWFGNAEDEEFAAVYLVNQWAKINGTWYYFDANGYAESTNDSISRTVAYFTNACSGTTSTVNTWRDSLYTLLYNNMTGWCTRQYTQNKIDLPVITITVNMVDISKTMEYAGYEHLQTVKLGDSVECSDNVHGISTTNRVIGITYDLIRECNEEVVIGTATASVSSMLGQTNGQAVAGGFDTSAIESQISSVQTGLSQLQTNKQDKLTAGDNITIVNNRISATGGGLSYWTETQKKIYNSGSHEGIGADANYFKTRSFEVGHFQNGNGWLRLMTTRIDVTDKPVVIGYTSHSHPMIVVASKDTLDNFQWGWSNWTFNKPYDVQAWADKDTYPLYAGHYENYFGYAIGTTTYNNETWNVLLIDCYTWSGGTVMKDINMFTFNEYSASNPNVSGAGLALLQQAHASVTEYSVTTQIATEEYPFKYGAENEDFAFVDEYGNGKFTEIRTKNGSLTEQMEYKNHISYGTSAPSGSATNGDLFILVDGQYHKTGMYLYVSNSWVQIE